MSNNEMSDFFDLLSNSYQAPLQYGQDGYLSFDEYEKSVYLTMAQEAFVETCYNGKNQYDLKFEVTEEDRRTLDALVMTVTLRSPRSSQTDPNQHSWQEEPIVGNASIFTLPSDVMFVTYESVKLESDDECANGSEAIVVPVTQDDFWKTYRNPFRGPNNHRALRLDRGKNTVEIVSNHPVGSYKVRYLRKPEPIVLVDMPPESNLSVYGFSQENQCGLDERVHQKITQLAVNLALQRKSIGNSNT